MVRIPDDLLAEIDRRAAEYGLTRAETMRRALADVVWYGDGPVTTGP